jgi:hypothetical protein
MDAGIKEKRKNNKKSICKKKLKLKTLYIYFKN